MFIRWKRQRRVKRGDVVVHCVLLRSMRVNGAPKQKVVGYLGRIVEDCITQEYHRLDFWDDVTPKLDAVPMSNVERAKIVKSIDGVVPKIPRARAAELQAKRDIGLPEFLAKQDSIFARLLKKKRRRRARCRHEHRCRLCGRCRHCGREV